MAKTIGPLMSLDASGTVAGTITFAKWKGRNYVRQRVVPANPQTKAQTGVRATFGGAVALWKADQVNLASAFDTIAKQRNISAFNAFTAAVQKQYSKGFSAANTPDPTNIAPTNNDTSLAVAVEGKYLAITWTDNTDTDAWASDIYIKDGTDPTAIWNLQAALVALGTEKFVIGPLPAATYHVGIASVSNTGGAHVISAAVTGTIV